jgi:hypothetical protein
MEAKQAELRSLQEMRESTSQLVAHLEKMSARFHEMNEATTGALRRRWVCGRGVWEREKWAMCMT